MSTSTPARAALEAAQSATHAGAGASFVALGSPLPHAAQSLIITSSLDMSSWISTDGTTDMLLVLMASSLVLDVSSNKQAAGRLAFPKGTQFYLKQGPDGAPTTGDISITAIYAR